jgi:hypothetical protein
LGWVAVLNEKLAIVFIHLSNSDYLKYSLGQARRSNPESPIYLIGDSSNNCYDSVQHHFFEHYSGKADAFASIYRHFSTNSFQFELFCLQRWFVLKEFLTTTRVDKCLYLDSDTMLYADVTREQKKFDEYDFTLSAGICGQTFFLNRLGALDDFCEFLMGIYAGRDKYHYDKMVAHFAVVQRSGLKGGASDMTAFELYARPRYAAIGEVSKVIDGSIFDININTPTPGFEMSHGIKKVVFDDNVPYGRYLKTGKMIRFNSLHFQGRSAKSLMSQYCAE